MHVIIKGLFHLGFIMKKPSSRTIVLLIFILFLIIAIPAAAESTVRFQSGNPVTNRTADLPTSSSFVSVRLDEGLFTLFAALNAAGYDDENFDFSYHPVRLQVRQELSERNFSGLERLRSQLKFVNTYQFTVWSLHYNPPPDFTRSQSGWAFNDIPALLFLGMDDLMRDFYDEMDIAALWQQVKPEYERVGQEYQQAAGEAVLAALEYTRMQDADLRQVVVIPNLLDAHHRGYGPQVGETAYVIVGPTGGCVDVGLIQHEALHSIAGPLVEEHFSVIDADKGGALYRVLRQQVPQGYGTWQGVVEEHVIRALGCRLAGADCEQYLLEKDETSGFLLMRPLVDKLAEFEASSLTLDEFMPELLGVLNEARLAEE
jgi:hypothetical protein